MLLFLLYRKQFNFNFHLVHLHLLKEAVSINALCACVYIYTQQLSSFRAPTLWFIYVTVATCPIQYTSLNLCQFFTRKRTKHENTRSPPLSYDTKMAADGYWARKASILRELQVTYLSVYT